MADPKTIASIEILHLDDLGYGPEGNHTRKEWREECFNMLHSTQENFGAWQRAIKQTKLVNQKNFGYLITYSDNSENEVSIYANSNLLDYIACEFDEIDFSGSIFFTEASFESAKFHKV